MCRCGQMNSTENYWTRGHEANEIPLVTPGPRPVERKIEELENQHVVRLKPVHFTGQPVSQALFNDRVVACEDQSLVHKRCVKLRCEFIKNFS
ncbi:hypothetical protein JOB18_002893 [Solea senegalensis]|uniref:Uncharacterized protein n=1 Tax=Solea senegalensis TaxID=28829 RepID=A0AAV6SNN5_SOLSE|nr:hypothetical protein JOB18_002893 [Solea senegalensis]